MAVHKVTADHLYNVLNPKYHRKKRELYDGKWEVVGWIDGVHQYVYATPHSGWEFRDFPLPLWVSANDEYEEILLSEQIMKELN